MTKQEYEAKLNVIDDDKYLGITNRLIVMNNLKREYIASLEAENAALIAKNAELERFVEKAIEKLAIRCPPNVAEGNCPKPDNLSCTTCWREFLMQSDDATQKEKP